MAHYGVVVVIVQQAMLVLLHIMTLLLRQMITFLGTFYLSIFLLKLLTVKFISELTIKLIF